MAGSGLIGIKRRIKSVTNTSKITRAMGLVATSKFRKAKDALDNNQHYTSSFQQILSDVISRYETPSIYLDGNGSIKKLYIVLTSDSGLCGSFNINIINKAVEELKADRENSVIMVVGTKGAAFFTRFNYEVAVKYVNIPDFPTLGTVNDFAMAAWKMYKNKEVGQVSVVYAHFISQSKQKIVLEQLLPFRRQQASRENKTDYIVLEPEVETILKEIVPLYMREKLLNCLLQSKTSEQATRMTAMDGATKSANQLLDELKLRFNRLRQSAITQEISEIVGGAEVQK